MSFISDILKFKSLSIVGLEKNTGKTVCLNFILDRLPSACRVAVTSIGIDGESKDQVTGTAKPEIILKEGTIFSTSIAKNVANIPQNALEQVNRLGTNLSFLLNPDIFM